MFVMNVGDTFRHDQLTEQEKALQDILTSLRSYYILGIIIGSAPFEWKKQNSFIYRLRNAFHWTYFISLLVLYAVLMLHNIVAIYLQSQKSLTTNTFFIMLTMCVLQIQFYQSMVFSFFVRCKLMAHFNLLASVDATFLKHKVPLNFSPRMEREKNYYFVYAPVSIVIKYGLLLNTHKVDIMQKIIWATATLGKSYLQHAFIFLGFQLKLRFDKINGVINYMLSMNRYKTVSLNDIQLINHITDNLYHLCRMHYKLCHLMRELNKTFAFQLLCSLAVSMGDILFQSYYLYHLLFNDVPNVTTTMIICPIVWLLDEMLEIYLLVHSCASSCESANTTPILLHELRNELDNVEIESHIQMYSLQLLHQKMHISALGFFNIDYSLLYSIIGAVTTYLVIFIQFDQQNSDTILHPDVNNCTAAT